MCDYVIVKEGKCKITKEVCPYVYYCNKLKAYKANNSIPKDCKIKLNAETPSGYYKVCFERKGNLYVSINGYIEIIPNPFDEVPLYVRVAKLKNGSWKIKDAK